MALNTYAGLQASIATWLHRDDLADAIPDFVCIAEEAMSRDLADLPVMWSVSGTITLEAGANELALPADSLGIVYVKLLAPWDELLEVLPLESLARGTGLDSSTTGKPYAVAFRANGGAAGTPTAIVWPKADQVYELEACYRAAVPALSGDNVSNFVLARAPAIYLYGALIASAPFLGQDARLQMWEAKYRQAVEAFRSQHWDGPARLRTDDLAGLLVGAS